MSRQRSIGVTGIRHLSSMPIWMTCSTREDKGHPNSWSSIPSTISYADSQGPWDGISLAEELSCVFLQSHSPAQEFGMRAAHRRRSHSLKQSGGIPLRAPQPCRREGLLLCRDLIFVVPRTPVSHDSIRLFPDYSTLLSLDSSAQKLLYSKIWFEAERLPQSSIADHLAVG